MKPQVVIVGLGNPGAQYARTRHNAGFQAIDLLSAEYGEGEWEDKQKFACIAQEARIVTAPALLVKPLTFMNRSGECIRKIVDFYKLDASTQILVLCDEIDIVLGEIRFREKGGPGTHNGLKSIVEQIGEGFPRMRIGVGPAPKGDELATWVLSIPSPDDEKKLQETLKTIPERVKDYVWEQIREGE
jgi:peptidyl-tRNA hydrolase, PTH1 family